MRSGEEIQEAIRAFGPHVWRACVLHFKDSPDAQDAFQETFLAYALRNEAFNDQQHEKAWLICVAMNMCRDMLRARSRTHQTLDGAAPDGMRPYRDTLASHDDTMQPGSGLGDVIEAMNALSDPPRTAVYLCLYEGYSAVEVARMLDAPVNTVYSWLSRGKKTLKEALS